MKRFTFAIFLLLTTAVIAQKQASIMTIDFVKIKNNNRAEALFYYENNWKVFRDIALERGYIKSYKLLTTTADTTANFDLILMTEYGDSTQYNLGEKRFQEIIKETRPGESRLLNELKPGDFRQNLFFRKTETLFSNGDSRDKKNK